MGGPGKGGKGFLLASESLLGSTNSLQDSRQVLRASVHKKHSYLISFCDLDRGVLYLGWSQKRGLRWDLNIKGTTRTQSIGNRGDG